LKLNDEDLIDELTQDIIAYVMKGKLDRDSFASKIRYENLDERYDDYLKLVDLHFILKEDVIDFVDDLEDHLRSIKTQTENISHTSRGSVEGRINWSKTFRKRNSQSPENTALFVCDDRSENYDIAENIVLKKLLAVINDALDRSEELLEKDYNWVNDTWREEELVEEMNNIFERNLHIRRISDPGKYEPTDRMIETALNSRQPVYRKAAKLLRGRQKLLNGEQEAVEQLLQDTAITPDNEARLFELFVLFKFISTIEDLKEDSFKLKSIESGKQEIARMKGEKELALYHDNSGPGEISFKQDLSNKNREELSRTELAQKKAREVFLDYMDKDDSNYTRKPDVIVLEIINEEENEYEYIIAEVKNSTNEDRIEQGIRETLEYLAFLRVEDNPETDQEDLFTENQGILVIRDLEKEPLPLDEQKEIKILQASDLEEDLGELIADRI
jgi:hypothetical protein